MSSKKYLVLALSSLIAFGLLTGCSKVKVQDEITEVKGWPATDGTNDIEDIVFALVLRGISFEYTTLRFLIPRFFNSLRITFANGHTEVL